MIDIPPLHSFASAYHVIEGGIAWFGWFGGQIPSLLFCILRGLLRVRLDGGGDGKTLRAWVG